MSMQQVTYASVGSRMLPGDVIAFSGGSFLTRLISPEGVVSHAGLILEGGEPGIAPLFVESTVHFDPKFRDKPIFGVRNEPANAAVSTYDGTVWWLPLGAAARALFNGPAFAAYIASVGASKYDLGGGVKVVLMQQMQAHWKGTNVPDLPGKGNEAALFCSELVAGALDASGVVSVRDISKAHPGDVTSWSIYEDIYYLLKGNERQIPNFNTTTPGTV
jgi:hypothetical protein